MPQRRKYQDNAAKMRAYRERKHNAESARTADSGVTFDELFRDVPAAGADTSDEWYTPRYLIDAARAVLSRIDLDPASSEAAQAVVQARRYYTQADNGLVLPWAGRVWCNPPYSDPEPWVKRLIAHHRAGEVPTALLLLNQASSPVWAHALFNGGYSVCFLAERTKFVRQSRRGERNSPMYEQFVWYLGPHRRRFARVFGALGFIR